MKDFLIAMDIGGCCADLKPERCFLPLGLQTIDAKYYPPELNMGASLFETGKIDRLEFARLFKKGYGLKDVDEQTVLDCWGRLIGDPMPGMDVLFRNIRQNGGRIVLFSDTSELHVEKLYEVMPFLKEADGAIFSHLVGWRKPDIRMFQAFEKEFGKPDLYVDDRMNNIEAGRAAGWNAWLFTGVDDLRDKLINCGLKNL